MLPERNDLPIAGDPPVEGGFRFKETEVTGMVMSDMETGMTGMVMSDLPVEREVFFEYDVDRHQRVRLLYRIVVEEFVYYGFDCVEAL